MIILKIENGCLLIAVLIYVCEPILFVRETFIDVLNREVVDDVLLLFGLMC